MPSSPGRALAPIIGRDDQLALALRRWSGAIAGSGHLLLVAGEAGIGKTRLLAEISGAIPDARHLTANVFPRDVEAVGGVIVDLSVALARAGEQDAAAGIRARLTSEPARDGDLSRSRRILVTDLAAMVSGVLEERPTLLRLEDLHWADELSLDVLERVATTIRESHSMIIATYRTDELYPRTPLRRLRARLLQQRLAEEVRLPRLDDEQTSALIQSLSSEQLSSERIAGVLGRSDGIPLYVEELLDDTSTVPGTIADAVTLQMATLDAGTIPVLEAAAVIGRSFDIDLLQAVLREAAAGSTADGLDLAVRELSDRNVVLPGEASLLDFRHALIRDAVYENISPLRRRDLHAAVATVAVAAGFSNAYVSDQFERARNPAGAYSFAVAAALDARRVSSNREAVELLRRAQRTAPNEIAPTERALLYADLAEVLAATDDNVGATTQLVSAIETYRSAGDELAAALLVPRLVAAHNLLGIGSDTRVQALGDELARLDALEVPAPPRVRAALLAALAAVHMLDRNLDEAIAAATAATALTEDGTAVSEQLDIELTLGAVLSFAGEQADGWRRLETAIGQSSELQLEALAARGYRMMGSSASMLVDYPRATKWIDEGIDYASSAERWNDVHYLEAHRAHVLWATGDWALAQTIAARALADGQGGITTSQTAGFVLGFLAFGRGEFEAARRSLAEAREIGDQMGELQRILPAVWGLAETELLDGNFAEAAELAEFAYSRSEPIGDAAYIFPFLTTGVRAYLAQRDVTAARSWLQRSSALLQRRSIPGTLPAISHGEGLISMAEGQTGAARVLLEEASAGWDSAVRFWEGTRALIDLAHCATRSRRPRDAARILEEVRVRATKAGASALLRLADQAGEADSDSGPLSARELEVARLVAQGATNREIAERLTISPKTASTHIEHILAKLGVARRAEIAAWITRATE